MVLNPRCKHGGLSLAPRLAKLPSTGSERAGSCKQPPSAGARPALSPAARFGGGLRDAALTLQYTLSSH